jgi:superfamily II DNA or RNA helicase
LLTCLMRIHIKKWSNTGTKSERSYHANVIRVVTSIRADLSNEKSTQSDIAEALDGAGIHFVREARLGPGDIADFLIAGLLRQPGESLAMTARTYGEIIMDAGGWTITKAEPHVLIRLKHVFPRIPKTKLPPYFFPATPSVAADLYWFMSRYPLEASESTMESIAGGRTQFYTTQAEMERILLPDYKPGAIAGLQIGQEVRHYQMQAVDILARSGGLLLGDEVGLGKTYTAAAAALSPEALPAIVVCQAHLQRQWYDVLRTFTTLRAYPVRGTMPAREKLPPVNVYIFRYTQVAGWADVLHAMRFGLAVFDEVQELRRGRGTEKGMGCWIIREAANLRLGLSATPIYNYGSEIWEVLRFLKDGELGTWSEFQREWCQSLGNGKWSVTDPAALGRYLREQYVFLRRTKKEVGQEMPPVNRIVDTVAYDAKSVHSIDEIARSLAIKATTGSFIERGQAARELDMLVRKQTGIAKAIYVARFVRVIAEGGTPVVLFGWHRDVYDLWLKELQGLNPAMYTGTESTPQKQEAKDAFLRGDTNVLIMSLRSGSGLDGLQERCSTAVFGELDWSPGVHHQCIGRLDREGQKEPVTAIFLVTDEGSDPPMMEVLGLKASEAAHIVDPSLGVQAAHTDISHLRKLAERYLDKKRNAA